MWTKRDEACWQHVMEWEKELAALQSRSRSGSFWERGLSALPEELKQSFLEQAGRAAFFLHSHMQHEALQEKAKKRILEIARLFQEDILEITDLHILTVDQLHYISRQQASKAGWAAAVQGAVTGTGRLVPLVSDYAVRTALHLHMIQSIGYSYGIDVARPHETKTVLHLLYVSMLPDPFKAAGWIKLITEVEENMIHTGGESWQVNEAMLEEQLQHIAVLAAARAARHQPAPAAKLAGIAVSAGAAFRAVQKTASLAEKYYQYRYLHTKKNRPS